MGDPRLLLIGWDSDQQGCGYSPLTEDYPYLYFPQMPSEETITDISVGNYSDVIALLNNGVCVKECPTANEVDKVSCRSTPQMDADFKFKDCVYYPAAQSTNLGIQYFTPFRYSTQSLLGHFCIPKGSDYVDEETYNAFKEAFFESSYGAASA